MLDRVVRGRLCDGMVSITCFRMGRFGISAARAIVKLSTCGEGDR